MVIDSSIRSAIMEQTEHREDICSGRGEIDEMKVEINDLKKCVKSLQIDVTELNLEVQFQEFSRLVEHEAFARDAVETGVRVVVDSEARLEISKLKEREMEVEMKLMEYNKNKEREIAELRTTVKTLIEYNEFKEKEKTAVAPVEDDVASELREAKEKIDVLRWKLRHKSRRAKEKIAALQFKIAELQHRLEINSVSDDHHHHHPKLEDEIAQLREVNSTLENDNTDLKHQLESILTSNSESRDELKRQIEQLEIDKCSDIHKAVYLKWINACLRYELRHYQPPSGEVTARDLSKSLSTKSAEKAKELIHAYARHESNGEEITPFEVVEVENVEEEEEGAAATIDDKNDVSSMNDAHRSGKRPKLSSLGSKLKKLVTRRDSSVRSKGCFSDMSFSSGCKQSISSESPRARSKKMMLKTSESAEIRQLSHALKNNKADGTTKSSTHSRSSLEVEQEHKSSTLFTCPAGA